tara:strand:- start:480 stop:659 length:180 start_codon:yes stop_codon:yes gene_type:complete
MQKTYKRELSLVMLGLLGVLFVLGMSSVEAMQAAEFLTTPIFLFATGAFGIDAYAKQVQ